MLAAPMVRVVQQPDPFPIFVGGTGRSGTTIVGRLLGSHPDYAVIPVEARFHSSPRGLPGVIGGTISAEDFAAKLLADYDTSPSKRRLARVLEMDRLEQALDAFQRAAELDPTEAARLFMQTVFGGYARKRGKRGWIEMTPRNLLNAPQLHRLFPEARFVDVVRDGRDVAASLLNISWKDDAIDALNWWESRIRQAESAVSKIPPEVTHRLSFERLMVTDRERTLALLLSFLGWQAEPTVRQFFDEVMSAGKAHVGRWNSGISEPQRPEFDLRYQQIIGGFRKDGIRLP